MTLPYPPPWQDAPTLCAHLCISESTLDNWIRDGILPPAQKIGGKRMWKWAEVDARLGGDAGIVPDQEQLARRVHNATKAAADR
jgi:predicted site-specific integrase-resolvase